MGYDWDDKRDICYRLYVEEKRSLEDVVDYFRGKLEFVPSKRTFQSQFRRWGFPTKLDYSHKDEAVVQRVREMWEKNVMQKDMLTILRNEGYNVSESGLMRLRFKHGMQLKGLTAPRTPADDASGVNATGDLEITASAIAPVMTPTGEKRKEREEALRVSNDQKWQSKKRRRHTKEWNGLPPDPPGPPRYPSETTIGEAQKFLGLADDMYREVRDRFRDICIERDIIKKTICGPERWEASKDYLIQETPYFQHLFLSSDPNMVAPLQLSLDIICMDVTKHMRMQSKNMSLPEAKNTLGLNPNEARLMKQKLFDILAANNFINTYESDNWGGLKDEWLEGTAVKDRMPTEEGPEKERFVKAIQLICRDTLKRFREAQRPPKGAKKQTSDGQDEHEVATSPAVTATPSQPKTTARKAPTRKPRQSTTLPSASDPRIDPSLLLAANTSSAIVAPDDSIGLYPTPSGLADITTEPPLPVYFRRSPLCNDIGAPPLWLGVLSSRSLDNLHRAAAAAGAVGGSENFSVVRVDAVAGMPDGTELLYQIDREDELQGYLSQNEGRKATFVVQLARRGA